MVTAALVALNIAVFVAELSSADPDALLRRWGVVPADILTSPAAWVTLVTSLFLHAGWLHLLSNGLYLAVFGGRVEHVLGWSRYVPLYLASGVLGGLAYVIAQSDSPGPAVGASGAIAGVIAAHLVLAPGATLGSIAPRLTVLLLALWFVTQFLTGVASIATTTTTGIAWWAHLGGFVTGLALARPLRPQSAERG